MNKYVGRGISIYFWISTQCWYLHVCGRVLDDARVVWVVRGGELRRVVAVVAAQAVGPRTLPVAGAGALGRYCG